MAVKIRLARHGAKKKPFYRIVVADSESPRDGRFLESLGTYDPKQSAAKLTVKPERVRYWMEKGATPTDTIDDRWVNTTTVRYGVNHRSWNSTGVGEEYYACNRPIQAAHPGGAQVDEAIHLRQRGAGIAIISEEHWAAALP